MGVLDKVMFWKKKDDFSDLGIDTKPGKDPFGASPGANDPLGNTGINLQQDNAAMNQFSPGLDTNPGAGLGNGMQSSSYSQNDPMSINQDPMQPRFGGQQGQAPTPAYSPQQEIENKNMEIISSKLDALRVSIDSLNQRLANLESMARGEQERPRRRLY